MEGVVVVIFEDSKGVLVSRQGAQWAWGGSAVDPNVNQIRAHSIQPRPDQGQTRPNQGPTSHQWPARSQPWARLAKVQPRVGPTRANQDPSKVRPVTALQGRRGRWTWKVGVEARLGSSVWNVGWQIRLGRSTWPVAWSWPALVCQGRPCLASCRRALLGDGSPCLATAAGAGTNEKSPKVNEQLAHRTAILMMLALGLVLLVLLGVCAVPPQTRVTRRGQHRSKGRLLGGCCCHFGS